MRRWLTVEPIPALGPTPAGLQELGPSCFPTIPGAEHILDDVEGVLRRS